MDDTDKRLVVYEARIEALERTVESLTDSVLKMESILDELASVFLPEGSQDDE